ncbi:MAG: type II 3-dehydroquinate dehydratase [Candidatus Omnitrophota bacterium]
MKAKMKRNKILLIHGPNLHLLGTREPQIYGKFTLKDINEELKKKAKQNGFLLEALQSNSEGEIVEKITNSKYDLLIINPAAYTHTSVAIRDAILAVNKPVIEVHLSNIYKREEFRKKSLISDISIGVITGFGPASYTLAFSAAAHFLKNAPVTVK